MSNKELSTGKKWSSDEIIKFLEVYEQHPCLWDVHSDLYKNRDSQVDAYHKIATTMAIDGFDSANVKSKIRSLRNAYTLELTKITKSKKSGIGADDVYKPKVAWFPVADRILHEVVHIRETQSTEISSGYSETQSLVDDIEDDTTTIVSHTSPTTPTGPSATSISATQKLKILETAPKRAKTSTRNWQSSTESILLELKKISASLNETPAPVEENEFDLFGKSVACQLKKLPEILALQSMQHIQSCLIQQRLQSTRNTDIFDSESRPNSADSQKSIVEYTSSSNSRGDTDTDILSQAVNAEYIHIEF